MTRPITSHFVYMLVATNGALYTGYTTDLERRMQQHQRGTGSKFVRGFGFKRLVYHEQHPSKSAALQREAALKRLSRTGKMAIIAAQKPRKKRGEKRTQLFSGETDTPERV